MCGIAGIFSFSSTNREVDRSLLERMRDSMAHRGPDDKGIYLSPKKNVGFGHRRLAIIDLSPEAAQPMSDVDGNLWIVFNGEIYNHAEIREELTRKGHRFKTNHSDTEVILEGFKEWKYDVVQHLRGMFAFVIWDERNQSMWAVRDRLGVKPLYYSFIDNNFIFASEIKALLEWPGLKRELNEKSFYDHLTFVSTPPPKTLFKQVSKLPAAHWMQIDSRGQHKIERYWNPFQKAASAPTLTEQEWEEKILAKLRESVRYRLVSDVKVGVFLSGGIDSSTNTALMAKSVDRPVETFSVGFENTPLNELPYAEVVAKLFSTHHHEIVMKPDALMDFLNRLIFHQDEPIGDPVSVPVYFLSKAARDNQVIVCHVGEGSDEQFCGYPYWLKMMSIDKGTRALRALPGFLRRAIYGSLAVNPFWSWEGRRRLDFLRRAVDDEPTFWGGAMGLPETIKRRVLRPEFLEKLGEHSSGDYIKRIRDDFKQDAPAWADDLHWMSYLDLRFRLPEILLMRVDKMSMAAGVEARVPFLDHEFVEMSMTIPKKMKIKNQIPKYLLKKSVEPVIPKEIIYRTKQGFTVPMDDWFQSKLGEAATKKIEAFAERTNYFQPDRLRDYLKHANWQYKWNLFNFALWHEHWIEGR